MLCNDDGIEAEGINVLYNCLAEKHQDGAEFCHKCGCKLHIDNP